MTTDTNETERAERTPADKNAAEDATFGEMLGAIDELIPPVETPREAPPLPIAVKKAPVVKKDQFPAVMKMKLKDLELSSMWNRDKLQNIDKLSQAILAEGQITPIVVHYRSDGKAVIIDGRRRYAALKEAGITEAIVTVRDCDEKEAQRLSIAANLAKEDHTPMELCRTFSVLRDQGNTIKEISRFTTHSENQVSQHLRLECLPDEAKKMLNAGKLDFSSARALCRLNYDDARDLKFFDKLLSMLRAGKLTVATIEAGIDRWINRRKDADKAAGKKVEKKRGRKATSKKENYDYLDSSYLKEIKPLAAKRIGELLNTYQDKKNNARNPRMRSNFDCIMQGIQMTAGLMDID
jgi:ParB/RepB/Spo0J family partition protein